MNKELKHLFTPGPMVSFRGSRKISSYLVRAMLYLVESLVGSFNCERPRFQIYTYVNETASLLVRLQERLTKLIVNLTAWRNP